MPIGLEVVKILFDNIDSEMGSLAFFVSFYDL